MVRINFRAPRPQRNPPLVTRNKLLQVRVTLDLSESTRRNVNYGLSPHILALSIRPGPISLLVFRFWSAKRKQITLNLSQRDRYTYSNSLRILKVQKPTTRRSFRVSCHTCDKRRRKLRLAVRTRRVPVRQPQLSILASTNLPDFQPVAKSSPEAGMFT